jgi:hypothetical protein
VSGSNHLASFGVVKDPGSAHETLAAEVGMMAARAVVWA